MVVFTNARLGASAELLVADEIAAELLRATAAAAGRAATTRWERELARWLAARATAPAATLDVSEIAWTPDHFEAQRRFLIEAIASAARGSDQAGALARWSRQIEAHPAGSVQVGRLWQWSAST